jgi:hypothetical protein
MNDEENIYTIMKRHRTNKDKERIALEGLADLLERDAVEIATDPRYTNPECAPPPIVGELQQRVRELRKDSRR